AAGSGGHQRPAGSAALAAAGRRRSHRRGRLLRRRLHQPAGGGCEAALRTLHRLLRATPRRRRDLRTRSEEHTSELQSREKLVCPGSNTLSLHDALPISLQVAAVTSALLAAPRWQPLVDAGRIGVAGFSAGGYTSLLVAGAKPRFERFIGYCERHPDDAEICGLDRKSTRLNSSHVKSSYALGATLSPSTTLFRSRCR